MSHLKEIPSLRSIEVHSPLATTPTDQQRQFIDTGIKFVTEQFFEVGVDVIAGAGQQCIRFRRNLDGGSSFVVSVSRTIVRDSGGQFYDGLHYYYLIRQGAGVIFDLETVRKIDFSTLSGFLLLQAKYHDLAEADGLELATRLFHDWSRNLAFIGEFSSEMDIAAANQMLPSPTLT